MFAPTTTTIKPQHRLSSSASSLASSTTSLVHDENSTFGEQSVHQKTKKKVLFGESNNNNNNASSTFRTPSKGKTLSGGASNSTIKRRAFGDISNRKPPSSQQSSSKTPGGGGGGGASSRHHPIILKKAPASTPFVSSSVIRNKSNNNRTEKTKKHVSFQQPPTSTQTKTKERLHPARDASVPILRSSLHAPRLVSASARTAPRILKTPSGQRLAPPSKPLAKASSVQVVSHENRTLPDEFDEIQSAGRGWDTYWDDGDDESDVSIADLIMDLPAFHRERKEFIRQQEHLQDEAMERQVQLEMDVLVSEAKQLALSGELLSWKDRDPDDDVFGTIDMCLAFDEDDNDDESGSSFGPEHYPIHLDLD